MVDSPRLADDAMPRVPQCLSYDPGNRNVVFHNDDAQLGSQLYAST